MCYKSGKILIVKTHEEIAKKSLKKLLLTILAAWPQVKDKTQFVFPQIVRFSTVWLEMWKSEYFFFKHYIFPLPNALI